MKRPGSIEFDSEALEAAEHWHGGQSSMLYAIVSTGSLSRGTIRPQSYDEDRPMTDDEWIADLASDLSCEAERCLRDARKMIKGKRGKERAEDQRDIDGLISIIATIEEWRS